MKRALQLLASATAALVATSAPAMQSDPAYQPVDEVERGIWKLMDDEERELKNSKFVIDDPALTAYVKGVLCKSVGEERCRPARVYLMRTPQYNAMMAPNGMMLVWTGLLLRTRNEAELATVLGHEYAHFDKRHSIQMFRDMKAKTNAMTWLAMMPGGFMAQMSLIKSFYAFNRDMEREADMNGIDYMARAGYDPMAASQIWEQLRAEMGVTAEGRWQRRVEDRGGNMFDSHPTTKDRMEYLKAAAEKRRVAGQTLAADSYRRALAGWWPKLIDDQIKLNDFKSTEFLLESMARGGKWSAELLYARGELYRARARDGDFAKAADFYRQAVKADPQLAESWRGLGMALLRKGDAKEAKEAKKALKHYVELRPSAADREMVAVMAGDQ